MRQTVAVGVIKSVEKVDKAGKVTKAAAKAVSSSDPDIKEEKESYIHRDLQSFGKALSAPSLGKDFSD
ncbi:hypothetical protein G6F56_011722 [Rhizopus delemar]|nr:hypothetical protein G6F56_011722 [Rhizopus delemar]